MWELSEAKFGKQSETSASVLLELADVYAKKKDTTNAIEYQQKALTIYKAIESIDPKILGSIAIKLSELFERANQIPEAIEALREASPFPRACRPSRSTRSP